MATSCAHSARLAAALDATKAKAPGFKEFVAKPFAIQTLADAIARSLGAAGK